MSGRTSIVTVSYRSFRSLQRLRLSLKAFTPEPYEWVILDNASDRPETLAFLDEIEAAGEATVIRNGQNDLFTRGCNLGIAKASGDPIVLLNPDCEVTKGWLSALLAVAARPRVGIVGAVLVNETDMVVHAGAVGQGEHIAYGERYRTDAVWSLTRQHDGWVTGACLLVTRAALNAAGGKLDERLRHHHSDRILCEMVRKAGYEIWVSGHVVLHSMGRAHW